MQVEVLHEFSTQQCALISPLLLSEIQTGFLAETILLLQIGNPHAVVQHASTDVHIVFHSNALPVRRELSLQLVAQRRGFFKTQVVIRRLAVKHETQLTLQLILHSKSIILLVENDLQIAAAACAQLLSTQSACLPSFIAPKKKHNLMIGREHHGYKRSFACPPPSHIIQLSPKPL